MVDTIGSFSKKTLFLIMCRGWGWRIPPCYSSRVACSIVGLPAISSGSSPALHEGILPGPASLHLTGGDGSPGSLISMK